MTVNKKIPISKGQKNDNMWYFLKIYYVLSTCTIIQFIMSRKHLKSGKL